MRWGRRKGDEAVPRAPGRREATTTDALMRQIADDKARRTFEPRPAGVEVPREVFLAVVDELAAPLVADGWSYARSGPHLTKKAGGATVKLVFTSGRNNVAGAVVLLWVDIVATDRAHQRWRKGLGLPDDDATVVKRHLGHLAETPMWLEWNLADASTRSQAVEDIAATIERDAVPYAAELLDLLPAELLDPMALGLLVDPPVYLELLVRAGLHDDATEIIARSIGDDPGRYATSYRRTLDALRRGTRDLPHRSPGDRAAWLTVLAGLSVPKVERRPLTIPPGLDWLRGRPDGADWIDALPGLVDEAANRWSLRVGEPFDGSSVSWVAPATDGSHEFVLKVQWPHPECEHEAEALRAWRGRGAIHLHSGGADHSLLLESCFPGTRLAQRPDVDPVPVIAELLWQLWIPARTPFRSLADEAADWRSTLWANWSTAGEPCERRLVEATDEFLRDLPGTQGEQVLLHQDLHGDNVLESRRGWLAIDPKPLNGERELGIAAAVRDVALGTDRTSVLDRFDRLTAELGLDRDRALGWTVAQTIAWAFSSGHAEHHYETARHLLDR